MAEIPVVSVRLRKCRKFVTRVTRRVGESSGSGRTAAFGSRSPALQVLGRVKMMNRMKAVYLLASMVLCALLASCSAASGNTCKITAAVTPSNATADHSAPAPANQVQFSLVSRVEGNCPLIPDREGSWSTSDPVNTAISSSQAPNQALATCLNATTTVATITYNGTLYGRSYSPATLSCK